MLLGIPPLYLIYYSYDIYVKRAKEKVTFDAERDSFHQELAASLELHDELRAAQLEGRGGDRARPPHPDGPPPHLHPAGRRHRAGAAHRVPRRHGRRLLRLHPVRRRTPGDRVRRRHGQGPRRRAHHGHGALAPARRHRAGQAARRRHGGGQRRAHPGPRGPAPAVLPHAGPGRLRPRPTAAW